VLIIVLLLVVHIVLLLMRGGTDAFLELLKLLTHGIV
jgi:hypothetical protein